MSFWSIITSDKEKADRIFKDVIATHNSNVVRHVKNMAQEYVDFEDGIHLIKLRPTENARGYRHTKLWIDKNIPPDLVYNVFLAKFIGEENDLVWI